MLKISILHCLEMSQTRETGMQDAFCAANTNLRLEVRLKQGEL